MLQQQADVQGVTWTEEPAGRGARAFVQAIRGIGATIWRDWLGRIGVTILFLFLLTALFAPLIARHPPFDALREDGGPILRNRPPSLAHPAGTNRLGQDLFSQLVWGARMALLVGVIAAVGGGIIGTTMGLVSGYFGRWTDQAIMRVTDIALAIPFLPFALVFLAFFGPGIRNIIFVLALLFWRSTARVIRSQVLSLKERPYIQAARGAGAGHLRIMFVHILPNVLPLVFLYLALGIGGAVAAEASLSFLGFGDPLVPTWGLMMNMAFTAGALRNAWWWIVFPGTALTLFVTSAYLTTRAYEEVVNPRLRRM
ncbi:MAG: ABC transporter permease [Dehalococcoidia bacterium]